MELVPDIYMLIVKKMIKVKNCSCIFEKQHGLHMKKNS